MIIITKTDCDKWKMENTGIIYEAHTNFFLRILMVKDHLKVQNIAERIIFK